MINALYYVIFPKGDRSRIMVKSIGDDVDEYKLASRKSWIDEGDAVVYARNMAKEHHLKYEGNDEGYLD